MSVRCSSDLRWGLRRPCGSAFCALSDLNGRSSGKLGLSRILWRRRRVGAARQTVAARVRAMRHTPERALGRLPIRFARVAHAMACVGPPGHRHVAGVDRFCATLRMAPVSTVGACRGRRGGGAVAAALTAVGQRPMRDLFEAQGGVRRAAAARAFIFRHATPERAASAIGGRLRRVVQGGPLLAASKDQRFSTFALVSDDQPPPRASMSRT